MSKFLTTVVETYRVDSESEVTAFIEEAKHDPKFELTKYTSEAKDVKSKGEIIDTYFKVTLTKVFNDIKEPDTEVKVIYQTNGYATPPSEVNDTSNNDKESEAFFV